MRTIVDGMKPLKSDAVLLVVSSPVDLLTSLVLQLSQLPPSQVLGSGTYLDSIRLRGMLADRIGVSSQWILYTGICDSLLTSSPGRGKVNRFVRFRRARGIAGGGLVCCNNWRRSNQAISLKGGRDQSCGAFLRVPAPITEYSSGERGNAIWHWFRRVQHLLFYYPG